MMICILLILSLRSVSSSSLSVSSHNQVITWGFVVFFFCWFFVQQNTNLEIKFLPCGVDSGDSLEMCTEYMTIASLSTKV